MEVVGALLLLKTLMVLLELPLVIKILQVVILLHTLPTFYAGINRDAYKGSGGVMHSNGNGFRIRVNNVTQVDIDDNVANGGAGGTNGINFKAVFMFDANGADTNNYVFGAGDTLTAKLAAANNMGPGTGTGSVNRAYSASYRAMVKADGEYYAGSLYNVDLSALSGANSSTFDLTENGASATWTLMDDMVSSINSLQWNGNHPNNLTVDGTTTISGSELTNITQVGFYLETTAAVNTGGYNFGVRNSRGSKRRLRGAQLVCTHRWYACPNQHYAASSQVSDSIRFYLNPAYFARGFFA